MARIGIDLGTTNTVVALVYDDGPAVVPRGAGRIIPSVVCFEPPVVGEDADTLPGAVRSVKRLMGRTWDEVLEENTRHDADGQLVSQYFDLGEDAAVRLVPREGRDVGLRVRTTDGEQVYWPSEISARVLREAREHAERLLGRPIEAASITVPAYFGPAHRGATLEAAALAGIHVIEPLLDEPTAAAVAFSRVLSFEPGETVLVVDWGGGTLDVTVLLAGRDEWHQVAIDGQLALGGDDVDRAFAAAILRKQGLDVALLEEGDNREHLYRLARQAKHLLSARDEAALSLAGLDLPDDVALAALSARFSRAELEAAIAPLVDELVLIVERCLDDPEVSRDAIRKVLLVGGSTLIPVVRRRLQGLLPHAHLHDEVDPMDAVALGAALQADHALAISRKSPFGVVLVDENGDHDMLPVGSSVPTEDWARPRVTLATGYDGQTVYRVTLATFTEHGGGRQVLQEFRAFARGFPPTAGGTTVDLEVWLDENKEIQASCRVEGASAPSVLPVVSRGELGPRAVFTELDDVMLDAEAVLEANEESDTGLLPVLRETCEAGKVAASSADPTGAARTRVSVRDLLDQVASRSHDRPLAADADDAARLRVLGWMRFFEQEVLPDFGAILSPATREGLLTHLRALNTMRRSGAEGTQMWGRYQQLLDELRAAGEAGFIVDCYRGSHTLGVPARLTEEIGQVATAARAALQSDRSRLPDLLEKLKRLDEEASVAFARWRSTEHVVEEKPDLRLV